MIVEREGKRVAIRSDDMSHSWYFYDGDRFDEYRIEKLVEYARVEFLQEMAQEAERLWEERYE